jgi:hypothetical protein
MSPLSSAAQFRTGPFGLSAGQGIAAPVPPGYIGSDGFDFPRWHPQHPLFWVGAFGALGLGLFAWATERPRGSLAGAGVRAKVGRLEGSASAEV